MISPYLETPNSFRPVEGWKHRWAARGYHPSKSNACPLNCPMPLLRKWCRRYRFDEYCICRSHFNDHGRRYRTDDGTQVVIWEPYADPDQPGITRLAEEAAAVGLALTVAPSGYWPGRTIALIIQPADRA